MGQDDGIKSASFTQQDKSPDDLAVRLQRAEQKGAIITALPKWAALAIITWQAAISIRGLSGAMPSLLLRIGRETSIWELVCWLAGVLGILYGAYSHHLMRRQKSQILSSYQLLENRLAALSGAGSDNGRSSGDSGGNYL
jgi:hypothetical protein